MSFKVGDRVRIINTKLFENNGLGPHFGTYGVISTTSQSMPEMFLVTRENVPRDRTAIWYETCNLEPVDGYPMEPPEMELEEIHKAQELFDDLRQP